MYTYTLHKYTHIHVHKYTYIKKRLLWRIMGNENILIFQKPFMFVSIHFFLL